MTENELAETMALALMGDRRGRFLVDAIAEWRRGEHACGRDPALKEITEQNVREIGNIAARLELESEELAARVMGAVARDRNPSEEQN